MEVNIQQIYGKWDLGYSLDKHTLSCVYTGDDQWGHPTFDTTRSEAGEALYQLKYHSDYKQISIISSQMYDSLSEYFSSAGLIVPMPPSKKRARQPAVEIANQLAKKMGIPCCKNLLKKTSITPQMKNIDDRKEKIKTLIAAFSVKDLLNDGYYNILLIDDLFDSGSSLEAATTVLRNYNKIKDIYVATVTRTK